MSFKQLSIPTHAHPLVKQLYEEMNKQRMTLRRMSYESGYTVECLKDWRTRSSPNICSIEACFNVLGFTLEPVKK